MLDGKEVVLPIGSYGEASLDIKDSGELEIAVSLKVNILDLLQGLAAKTSTPLDDKALEWVKSLLK
jgi:hypothetical protein